ncbi:MAG TPA: hypothetical protein PLD20_22530 [Blastocatellia bacterium]|nr:hypothetical protein [Blastocatellia bacterium]HMX29884.1 hypothetical protein [Blastocatellia bacterium]HMY72779.1 hypothetical protein [Blastocatellia bacterium]HMZ20730.1 hypothetical protein [Blastocatellia bacterium]HNG34738.1 hypothetical protein [Blastocatellia bacterium]
MQSVQVQITTEQLFEAIEQLPIKEQFKLRNRLNQLPEQKKGSKHNGHRRKTRDEIEADLLTRIRLNSTLPDAAHRRYRSLRRKIENNTINEEELKELQFLNSRYESMSVERLAAVMELAELRGTDFKTTWEGLGLGRIRHAG